jgi:hypothetical protein
MMRFQQQTALLTTCIFISTLFASIGCKSGAFKTPDFAGIKKPDLSGLAFWKKESSAEVPPPPSRRFDPAPGGDEQKMARLDSTIKQGGNDIQDSFNRMVQEAKNHKDGLAQKPIRTPYSISEKSTSTPNETDNSNSFDIANTKSQIELPNLDSSVQKAQQDFQAALASSGDAIKDSLNTKASETVSTWKNDFQLPAKIAKAQQQIKPEDLKINRKLYDMSGNLSSGAQSAVNQFAEASQSLQSKVNSGFEVGKVKTQNQFIGAAENAKEQLKQFGSDSQMAIKQSFNSIPNTQPTTQLSPGTSNQSQSELKAVQAQVSLAQQQIAELKRQLADGKASMSSSVNNQSNAGNLQPTIHVASLLMPNSQSNNNALASDGQANLVQSNNGNFSPLQNNAMTQMTQGSVSQSTMPPASAQVSSNQMSAQPPASPNVLRSNSQFGIPARTQSPSSSAPTGQPLQTQPANSQYPATPHGGYSSPSMSNNQLGDQPANGLATTQKSQVINADSASAFQVGAQSGVSKASHVSDVEMPAAILQGSGSYAPGSVNPLSQQK